eukprot:PhM_4_TR18993/c0_g1_i1/m.86728
MADEDMMEDGEQRPENPYLGIVTTPEEFKDAFAEDDKLFCIVALSKQCPLCKPYEAALHEVSQMQPDHERVRFACFNVEDCPDAARELKLCSVPSVTYGMAAEVWEGFSGNNVEKFKAMLKNNLAKRNEKMKESDKTKAEAAKAAAAAAAAAEAAEE